MYYPTRIIPVELKEHQSWANRQARLYVSCYHLVDGRRSGEILQLAAELYRVKGDNTFRSQPYRWLAAWPNRMPYSSNITRINVVRR